MFEKIVTYKNEKYWVRHNLDKNLWGTVEFDTVEPIGGYYNFKIQGDFSSYGDNYINVISNIIRDHNKEKQLRYEVVDKFLEWDGTIL